MSKSAVALLCALFIGFLLAMNTHYYYALDQQYKFTEWVLTAYCPRGTAK